MITVAIALLSGIIVFASLHATNTAMLVWALIWGLFSTLLVQVGISLIIRKKVNLITSAIQSVMLEGQKKINARIQQFQTKPLGGTKAMQKILEKEQSKFLEDAINITKQLTFVTFGFSNRSFNAVS